MKVNAVLFDLDGTLTKPYLDFDQIRRDIGITQGPILEAMAQMTPEQQLRANNILIQHELDAANNSLLHPGVQQMLANIRQKNRSVALVTRNSPDSVKRICHIHNLEFDSVVTREDGPVKPDPFSVLKACE
ncbi:MAG: HAD family phosphatase, partial [Planctomycetes bacterium]|nr:HAD family phosphatase [Planctomycetota bacterium]